MTENNIAKGAKRAHVQNYAFKESWKSTAGRTLANI